MKRIFVTKTIFGQLILNIIVPVVIALFVLGALNYYNTKQLLTGFNEQENHNISEEILNYLALQDLALGGLETDLDERLEKLSNVLINSHLSCREDAEKADLIELRKVLGMDTINEDIYIINAQGVVVNTTFPRDLGLDLCSFGHEHKEYLQSIMKEKVFRSERFAIEAKTKRIKKYSYHACPEGNFIVEIGVYSKEADRIVDSIKATINKISGRHESLVNVELFIGAGEPFSLSRDVQLDSAKMSMLKKVFEQKRDTSFFDNAENVNLHHSYIYLPRQNTDLYKDAVVQIVANRADQQTYLWHELLKLLGIFIVAISIVIVMIYNKAKVITQPIKRLVENVTRIAGGNFNERALVEGDNEIATLSEHFNFMLEKIEEYYNELEQKVEDRTREVRQQKEEIETQRDDLAEKNEYLHFAYHKIELQNKNITDSIHYAERIQRAILPPTTYVKAVLQDYFVLYQPKDIVSGDFYWVNVKEDLAMVAAVDCTGHGVPGAFMSIIGNENLNHVVNVDGFRQPDQILNALNERITGALNQDNRTKTVKDGMDMSFCVIDRQRKVVSFAGANNPIYFVSGNELHIIKGDKFPIGASVAEQPTLFTNNEIPYRSGDQLYLFSDGFADQFGGPDNKKFMYKRLREVLLSVSALSMEEQRKTLLSDFDEWKGEETQIDDVLIIGVRLT